MKIYFNFEEASLIKNPVVTTGSFDGVHVGHKAIINRLNKLATSINGESVLITFHPHPRKVLFPETEGKNLFLINSQKEKIELLRQAGLDHLFIIKFTKEFSEVTSIDFIRQILVGKLHAKMVVIGYNHHFGHNREGDYQYLYELGKYYNFYVEEIPEQDIKNEAVSSTKIRKALLEGDIQKANAYLDHHYVINSKLLKGSEICDRIDFPTYSIIAEEDCKLIPPQGVYAVNCMVDGIQHKGMLNIKNKDENKGINLLELHLFESHEAMYDKECVIYFAKRIRDEMTFNGFDDLKRQLIKDRSKIDELIY